MNARNRAWNDPEPSKPSVGSFLEVHTKNSLMAELLRPTPSILLSDNGPYANSDSTIVRNSVSCTTIAAQGSNPSQHVSKGITVNSAEDNAQIQKLKQQNERQAEEIRALSKTIEELNEMNGRVINQNIDLLHDLEVAQKTIRDLRADRDSLAVFLKSKST